MGRRLSPILSLVTGDESEEKFVAKISNKLAPFYAKPPKCFELGLLQGTYHRASMNNEWDPLSNFSLFDRQDLELDMYILIKILVVCLCLLRGFSATVLQIVLLCFY